MTAITLLPFILFIVVIITSLSEKVHVPYPLMLVITGLFVGFLPGISMWHPPPEAILSVFLPPILFSAARLTAWRDVRDHLGKTIISLSVILVVLSMVVVATVLNYFLPDMNLGAAMALGAIIAPTDTVAACSIMQRMNVKQHIIRTVEIESLFNDAMGILLFKIALFYVFFGSLSHAMISTHALWIIAGGIGTGIIFAFFSGVIIEYFLLDSKSELPIIMSLVLAYVSYMFAEQLGASGVLAVVSAGLFHRRTETRISANTRLTETSVWETLLFFLNGLIFIAIGIQFPSSLKAVESLPHTTLFYASLLTILTLLILRFTWISLTNWLLYLLRNSKQKPPTVKKIIQQAVVVSWSGMRGLVSLALALSLPYALPDQTLFPYRDLLIFLTFVTILFTLLVQGLTLPWVIRKLGAGKSDTTEASTIDSIYDRLTKKAVKKMEEQWPIQDNYTSSAKKLVKNYYANRQSQMEIKTGDDAQTVQITLEAQELLSQILQYERTVLEKLRRRGDISEEIFIKLLRKIDRDEVGFESYH